MAKIEEEKKELSILTNYLSQDPVLMGLWNNEKDSAYDKFYTLRERGRNKILIFF